LDCRHLGELCGGDLSRTLIESARLIYLEFQHQTLNQYKAHRRLFQASMKNNYSPKENLITGVSK
jgi:hypothetical protein